MSEDPSLKPFIRQLMNGEHLTEGDARQAFEIVMTGCATQAQIGALLMGLHLRGETVDEITGAATVIRAKASQIIAPMGAIDTCGTGGALRDTYNVSTCVAIVLASLGVPVAKHGNRAMSSKSGSADVLEALGINLDADMARVEACLNEVGITFMLAGNHHAAMRHVGSARRELGIRTVFNILGPLSNPAQVKRQVLGVFHPDLLELMAQVLGKLGAEHVWVVHGKDGLDELTTTGPTQVVEFKHGELRRFEVNPEEVGLPTADLAELIGGDAEHNAAALTGVLAGAKGPYRDIVVLNAAAGLLVSGKVDDLKTAASLACRAIDEGRATRKLAEWAQFSQTGTL